MIATVTCVSVILLCTVLLSWTWFLPCVFRRWDVDGWVNGMVVEIRTDGGQGNIRTVVCTSTCRSKASWREARHCEIYIHPNTCVCVCPLKASAWHEGYYHLPYFHQHIFILTWEKVDGNGDSTGGKKHSFPFSLPFFLEIPLKFEILLDGNQAIDIRGDPGFPCESPCQNAVN